MNSFLKRSQKLSFFSSIESSFWLIDTKDITSKEIEEALVFLNNADLKKISKFLLKQNYNERLIVYAILKCFLGNFLQIPLKNLELIYNSYGKPYLNKTPIHFNISYTHKYALIGFHSNLCIGVDIEQESKELNLLDMVDKFLLPPEKKWLFDEHIDPKRGAFTLWSAKEALLKAMGTGFGICKLPLISYASSYQRKYSPSNETINILTFTCTSYLPHFKNIKIYVCESMSKQDVCAICVI